MSEQKMVFVKSEPVLLIDAPKDGWVVSDIGDYTGWSQGEAKRLTKDEVLDLFPALLDRA